SSLKHALSAFQAAHHLPETGEPNCETWAALGGDATEPSTTTYEIAEADVSGPFQTEIPRDLIAQAKLPALSYKSPEERIGERFHASPDLLRKINRSARFAAGERITVPAVEPFDPDALPTAKTGARAAAPDVVLQ